MEGFYDDLKIVGEIGKGSWSVVKQAYLKTTQEQVAVKIETVTAKGSLLLREAAILRHLQGIEGVPLLYQQGSHGDKNYMVMQRLKYTLDVLRSLGQMGVCDVLQRAQQLISTLSQIHKRGIIHQDLQPKNLMSSEDSSVTYFIDFGLAASILQTTKNPRTIGIIGTPCFSSMSALLGIEQDYKDDLKSLGYNLVWLIRGSLPWEKSAREGRLANLKAEKFKTPVSLICQGCPDELVSYFSYVKGLQYKQVPDYQFLRGLLERAVLKLQNLNQIPESFSVKPRARFMSEDLTSELKSKALGLSPEKEAGRTVTRPRSRSNAKESQITCNLPLAMPTTSMSLEGHLGIKSAAQKSELRRSTRAPTYDIEVSKEASLSVTSPAVSKSGLEHRKKRHSVRTPNSAGLHAHTKRHSVRTPKSAGIERSTTPKRGFNTLKFTNREKSCTSEYNSSETPKAICCQKTHVTNSPSLCPTTRAKIAKLKAALKSFDV
jgi:serine/threonine protein kinase